MKKRNSFLHEPFGFSLIETVIALGIMGLAVTALLGLIPQGLKMSKNAANAGAQARILDTIKSDLAHFSFSQLGTLKTERLLFDDEGILLDRSESNALVSYVAEIINHTSTGSGFSLPGSSAEPYVGVFEVRIANSPLATFDFKAVSPNSYYSVPLHLGPAYP